MKKPAYKNRVKLSDFVEREKQKLKEIPLNVRLSAENYDRLEELAHMFGVSKGAMIRLLIDWGTQELS